MATMALWQERRYDLHLLRPPPLWESSVLQISGTMMYVVCNITYLITQQTSNKSQVTSKQRPSGPSDSKQRPSGPQVTRQLSDGLYWTKWGNSGTMAPHWQWRCL